MIMRLIFLRVFLASSQTSAGFGEVARRLSTVTSGPFESHYVAHLRNGVSLAERRAWIDAGR